MTAPIAIRDLLFAPDAPQGNAVDGKIIEAYRRGRMEARLLRNFGSIGNRDRIDIATMLLRQVINQPENAATTETARRMLDGLVPGASFLDDRPAQGGV